jgi:NADPH:quinone reductase-like Zn-dependent oxidoreductase
LKLVGSKNASIAELREVMGLIAQSRLKPVIDSVFPLAAAAQAHARIESREFFGKVVLAC